MAVTDRKPTFKEPHDAFDHAIQMGVLSPDPDAERYAGEYMYMGTWGGIDHFKHIVTRRYLYLSGKGSRTSRKDL